MALKIVQPGDGRNLQISGIVEKGGKSIRFRRSAKTRDMTTALMRAREYERQILGLLPSIDMLRMALEMIVLLAEGGRVHELPRILSVAEKALALLPKPEEAP
jgi:hypothetical protein